MRRMTWNDLLMCLTLVRFGQQLGTDSKVARAVFDLLTALGSLLGRIS